MRTIDHEELKQMLDRQDHFHLVMALGEWAYQAKHIPGSIHFATMREALHALNKEDEIVVYCSDENCIASTALGQLLERNGYPHVLHFAGGLSLRGRVGQTVTIKTTPAASFMRDETLSPMRNVIL